MGATTLLLSLFALPITSVLANTEKAIFLGPEAIPVAHPLSTLSNLRLDMLTPSNGALRTKLTAQFPTKEHPKGPATWLVLDKLTPNQRYEVRVCWPATQPTEFSLSTFPLSTVWDDPDLMASLHDYSVLGRRRSSSDPSPIPGEAPSPSQGSSSASNPGEKSILLLRILAAADYFTTNTTLMAEVPPVDVDIILDPFLMNVLPRSIAGTAAYIVVVAVVAYLLAGRIASWIQGLIDSGEGSSREEVIKKRQ